MKKFLLTITCAILIIANIWFAQYGWWWAAYSSFWGWYPSYALSRDICSNGDKSPSFFDWSCGDTLLANEFNNQDLLVTGPREIKKILQIPGNSNDTMVEDDTLISPDTLPETWVRARNTKKIFQIIWSNSPSEIVDGLTIPTHLPETWAWE